MTAFTFMELKIWDRLAHP